LGGFPAAVMLTTGEIIVQENGNHRIRRIGTDGLITTIAGTNTVAGDTGDDGLGTAALIRSPSWITPWRGSHVMFWQQSTSPRAIRGIW
jgi:hypothetical protein